MEIFVYYVKGNTDHKIIIWSKADNSCIAQEYYYGKKSKKATAKIKEYNGNRYIMCKGHRYYLNEFAKIEI